MTNQTMQTFLENMTTQDLLSLKKYYESYIQEETIINNVRRQIEISENEKIRGPKSQKKELELAENLSLAQKLSSQNNYQVKANLNKYHKIDELIINGQKFNTSPLDSKAYTQIFFKKDKHHLFKIILSLLISMFLLRLGLFTHMPMINVLGGVSVIVTIKNVLHCLNNNYFKNQIKTKITRQHIKSFTKKLSVDYEKEKNNSQIFHEQNLIFNESRKNVFSNILKIHLENQNIIAEAIQDLLSNYLPLTEELDNPSERLSEEELENVQKLVEGYQKTLKNSHYHA